jgi:hypothetical protein
MRNYLSVLTILLLLAADQSVSSSMPQAGRTVSAFDLDSFLEKAAEYCRKHESAALDFVCLEEVSEVIDPALEWRRAKKINNEYLYDYQCTRSGGKLRETRTLLKENGKSKNEKNAELGTSVFEYTDILFGPAALFPERVQKNFGYKIEGRDEINGRPVVIIGTEPREANTEAKKFYGKAWIDAQTFDILKIDWSESRFGNYDIIEQRAKLFKRTPRVTVRSEFSAEKNGIRFPSGLFIEEAYLDRRGRPFIRSRTTATYKNFKFFVVEVIVKNGLEEGILKNENTENMLDDDAREAEPQLPQLRLRTSLRSD